MKLTRTLAALTVPASLIVATAVPASATKVILTGTYRVTHVCHLEDGSLKGGGFELCAWNVGTTKHGRQYSVIPSYDHKTARYAYAPVPSLKNYVVKTYSNGRFNAYSNGVIVGTGKLAR